MNELKIIDENDFVYFRQELKAHEKKIITDLKRNKGWIKRLCYWLTVKICRGPIPEIFHNWLIVYAGAMRSAKYLEKECPTNKEKIETLATIMAYEEMARFERDFATAWSFVNIAMSLLPLVSNDKEVEHCKFLMSVSQEKKDILNNPITKTVLNAIDLYNKLKSDLEDDQKIQECRENIFKLFDVLFITTPPPNKTNSENEEEMKSGVVSPQSSECGVFDKRYQIYEKRLNDTQKWNRDNRQISLKLSLWRSLGYIMFLTLLIAITFAEVSIELFSPLTRLYFYPFLYISIFGFFGGGLSSFIRVREEVVSIPSYRLIRMHTFIRMILGAAGAFVVFVTVNWISKGEALIILTNPYAFIGLGIASGFSERLFINALEKMSNNLTIGSEEKSGKNDSAKETKTEEAKNDNH